MLTPFVRAITSSKPAGPFKTSDEVEFVMRVQSVDPSQTPRTPKRKHTITDTGVQIHSEGGPIQWSPSPKYAYMAFPFPNMSNSCIKRRSGVEPGLLRKGKGKQPAINKCVLPCVIFPSSYSILQSYTQLSFSLQDGPSFSRQRAIHICRITV